MALISESGYELETFVVSNEPIIEVLLLFSHVNSSFITFLILNYHLLTHKKRKNYFLDSFVDIYSSNNNNCFIA